MADNKTKQVETNLDLLNGLTDNAVVLDGDGFAWQRWCDSLCVDWYPAYGPSEAVSTYELANRGTITALVEDKTRHKHVKPKGFVHTRRGHYDAQCLLDSLPAGTAVLDCLGTLWQLARNDGYWYSAADYKSSPMSSYDLSFQHPITPLTTK